MGGEGVQKEERRGKGKGKVCIGEKGRGGCVEEEDGEVYAKEDCEGGGTYVRGGQSGEWKADGREMEGMNCSINCISVLVRICYLHTHSTLRM